MRLQKFWTGREGRLIKSKAYKQVPLNQNAQAMCVLGYFDKGEWKYFTISRLPFGATSAVYTFNRISRSIHHILCHFPHVVCRCLCGDFPALSSSFGAALVTKSMSVVLDLLGWEHGVIASLEFTDLWDVIPAGFALCDLGSPGWGEPWFPHSAVLLLLTNLVWRIFSLHLAFPFLLGGTRHTNLSWCEIIFFCNVLYGPMSPAISSFICFLLLFFLLVCFLFCSVVFLIWSFFLVHCIVTAYWTVYWSMEQL